MEHVVGLGSRSAGMEAKVFLPGGADSTVGLPCLGAFHVAV